MNVRHDLLEPQIGYDDWTECLGVALQQFWADSSLGFEDWALIRGLGLGLSTRFVEGKTSNHLARLYRHGVVSDEELLENLLPVLLSELATMLASHRAGGDWLAHLATSSGLANSLPLEFGEQLAGFYAAVFSSAQLEQLWQRCPSEPGREVDANIHRHQAKACAASLSVDTDALGEQARSRYEPGTIVAPSNFRLKGLSLVDNEVFEAADQVRLTGGWPALTMEVEGNELPRMLVPSEVSLKRIVAVDILAEEEMRVMRLGNTTTGWVASY